MVMAWCEPLVPVTAPWYISQVAVRLHEPLYNRASARQVDIISQFFILQLLLESKAKEDTPSPLGYTGNQFGNGPRRRGGSNRPSKIDMSALSRTAGCRSISPSSGAPLVADAITALRRTVNNMNETNVDTGFDLHAAARLFPAAAAAIDLPNLPSPPHPPHTSLSRLTTTPSTSTPPPHTSQSTAPAPGRPHHRRHLSGSTACLSALAASASASESTNSASTSGAGAGGGGVSRSRKGGGQVGGGGGGGGGGGDRGGAATSQQLLDYLSGMTSLNMLFSLLDALRGEVDRPAGNLKYIAHQIALLYRSLASLGLSHFKSRIESNFEALKRATSSASGRQSLVDEQREWLSALLQDLLCEVEQLPLSPGVVSQLGPLVQLMSAAPTSSSSASSSSA